MTRLAANRFLPALDPQRPPKNFADYAAVAICPLLIMLIVGSFVFFLLEVGYAGSHLAKLRWTIFWFVLAMVLVSRIAIEKGYDRAGIFGLGLAAATAFVLTQYVNNYLGAWCILGLIWWATNKLTWDCTVIDDDLDASGEGLLQAAKLDSPENPCVLTTQPDEAGTQSRLVGAARPGKAELSKLPWWKLGFRNSKKAPDQPHAPGRWVLYFSLAALPLFGLGAGLIPVGDESARVRSFVLLLAYLAAALGLLLITSFLGLRRYLRQRHLVMPPAISVTWVSLGSTVGLAILLACMLLPRPNTTWSFGELLDRFGDPGPKTPEKRGQIAEANDRPQGPGSVPQQSEPGMANNGSIQGATETRVGSNSQTLAANGQMSLGNDKIRGGSEAETQAASSNAKLGSTVPSRSTRVGSGHLNWLKAVTYAAVGLFFLLVTLKNRQYLLLFLKKLWQVCVAFWSHLFGSKDRSASLPSVAPTMLPELPFSSFSNPFSSGEAARMPVRDLVVYTFRALEAWAAAYRFGRDPDQTPFEFADHLVEQAPELSFEVQQITRLYVQIAYGAVTELPPCQSVLELLWSKMTREVLAKSQI